MNRTNAIINEYYSKIVDPLEYYEDKREPFYQEYDKSLREIFATWHIQINWLFSFMNDKSLTNGHFNAGQSRELIEITEDIEELQELLKETEFSFEIEETTKQALVYSKTFLTGSGGSAIPDDYTKINILKYDQMFLIESKNIHLKNKETFDLKQIGRGAFATVSKYSDPEYNIDFAVKILNKNSDEREIKRFKEEYKILKSLDSPYVLQVF